MCSRIIRILDVCTRKQVRGRWIRYTSSLDKHPFELLLLPGKRRRNISAAEERGGERIRAECEDTEYTPVCSARCTNFSACESSTNERLFAKSMPNSIEWRLFVIPERFPPMESLLFTGDECGPRPGETFARTSSCAKIGRSDSTFV